MTHMGKKKRLAGYAALAWVCVLLGMAAGASFGTASALESGVKLEGVVTSPFTAAVELVHDSVVGVSNYRVYQPGRYGGFGFGFDNRGGERSGETREVLAATGSGTVISAQGHVLTNFHVIDGASSVKVTANGTEYDAEVLVFDADLDVAVLIVEGLNIAPVALGDSDVLKIGDWAICIGNPLSSELVGTTTVGIVSGLNRNISTGNTTDKYGRRNRIVNTMIQVDASINEGNSGGGMFNVLGELVGIPTIKYSTSGFFSRTTIDGIGMCIPINEAKPLIENALKMLNAAPDKVQETPEDEGSQIVAPTPRMGIMYMPVNGETFSSILPSGAYISDVEEGSPAEEAGLLPGDIIVEADGKIIGSSSEELKAIVSVKQEGDLINLTVYRAEGLKEAMDKYFDPDASLAYSDIPDDGEYIDFQVMLKILDEAEKQ